MTWETADGFLKVPVEVVYRREDDGELRVACVRIALGDRGSMVDVTHELSDDDWADVFQQLELWEEL